MITYCTIGNRASEAWFALKYLLGYPNARVYSRLAGRVGERGGHTNRDLAKRAVRAHGDTGTNLPDRRIAAIRAASG